MQGRTVKRIGSRVVGGVIAIIVAVAAVSLYTFWRVDRVQENVALVNQFYVPALKHLNLLSGKWSAYQRAYEQAISFRKWGARGLDVASPKPGLRKMVEGNLAELQVLLSRQPASRDVPERFKLEVLINELARLAEAEPARIIEITSLLKAHQYAEAAALYGRARAEHLAFSQGLLALNRAAETSVTSLQLVTEQELRGSQGVMLTLLGLSLLFSVVVMLRLRLWILPVVEWTRFAQHIALRGLQSLGREVRFPQVTRSMPPELALLTRELTRMGMTVLERERTIQQQKEKLEALNQHLKEQNERLRKLGGLNERVLNGMSSGLLVIEQGGKVEQFNERYCQLFGLDRNHVIGRDARALLSAWPVPVVEGWLAAQEPLQLKREKFSGRVFDVRVQPLAARDGQLLLFEDVTELAEAEERLEHAKKLMLAGNMSSQVAHEVRNPLNSMSLYLEMLEEDLNAAGAAPEALARARAVFEQVGRLERITQRYLDVKRAAPVQRDPLGHPAVDLHEVIERSLSFMSGELQAQRVRVRYQFSAGPLRVAADGDALSQVVFNLVRNAVESMKTLGEGEPHVLTITTFADGSTARVRVEDNGPGVGDEMKTRLFEPFATDKVAGHGLGLSVSRQICIDHGGELRFVEAAKGAVFECEIPLARAAKVIERSADVARLDR